MLSQNTAYHQNRSGSKSISELLKPLAMPRYADVGSATGGSDSLTRFTRARSGKPSSNFGLWFSSQSLMSKGVDSLGSMKLIFNQDLRAPVFIGLETDVAGALSLLIISRTWSTCAIRLKCLSKQRQQFYRSFQNYRNGRKKTIPKIKSMKKPCCTPSGLNKDDGRSNMD